MAQGIIPFAPTFCHLLQKLQGYVQQTRSSSGPLLLTTLLHGIYGSGKSALTAHVARMSDFPFIRRISGESLAGETEHMKLQIIKRTFEDAHKSPLSLIVLDDIERLIDYACIGQRFSNNILQLLFGLLKKRSDKALAFTTLPVKNGSEACNYRHYSPPQIILTQSCVQSVNIVPADYPPCLGVFAVRRFCSGSRATGCWSSARPRSSDFFERWTVWGKGAWVHAVHMCARMRKHTTDQQPLWTWFILKTRQVHLCKFVQLSPFVLTSLCPTS